MLELVDLSKKYKQVYAVNQLNMVINKGEIVGLLGPNGAGKSTAISMMSSLVEPTSGDVHFLDKSILKNPAPLRKVIGVVPQEIALYMDLTAEENLRFFGRIYGLKGTELNQKMEEVLAIIGLTDRKKKIVKTENNVKRLSGCHHILLDTTAGIVSKKIKINNAFHKTLNFVVTYTKNNADRSIGSTLIICLKTIMIILV